MTDYAQTFKLPSSLKIGGYTFVISYEENPLTEKEPGRYAAVYGQVVYGSQKIRINTASAPEWAVATLLHECCHALLIMAGHTDHEEVHVAALGHGLFALLRDNPALVAAIQADYKPKEKQP